MEARWHALDTLSNPAPTSHSYDQGETKFDASKAEKDLGITFRSSETAVEELVSGSVFQNVLDALFPETLSSRCAAVLALDREGERERPGFYCVEPFLSCAFYPLFPSPIVADDSWRLDGKVALVTGATKGATAHDCVDVDVEKSKGGESVYGFF